MCIRDSYETASAQEVFLSPGDTGWSAETCNMLNNYMSNVSSTLAAMERLTRELNARPEPFVLVLFGDHKPWMGNGNTGYTEIGAGFDLSQLSGFREYYSTPYLIWANSAAREALGNSFTGAVSYTHLDVYKRQTLYPLEVPLRSVVFFMFSPLLNCQSSPL